MCRCGGEGRGGGLNFCPTPALVPRTAQILSSRERPVAPALPYHACCSFGVTPSLFLQIRILELLGSFGGVNKGVKGTMDASLARSLSWDTVQRVNFAFPLGSDKVRLPSPPMPFVHDAVGPLPLGAQCRVWWHCQLTPVLAVVREKEVMACVCVCGEGAQAQGWLWVRFPHKTRCLSHQTPALAYPTCS